jgi:hypothetical protein
VYLYAYSVAWNKSSPEVVTFATAFAVSPGSKKLACITVIVKFFIMFVPSHFIV